MGEGGGSKHDVYEFSLLQIFLLLHLLDWVAGDFGIEAGNDQALILLEVVGHHFGLLEIVAAQAVVDLGPSLLLVLPGVRHAGMQQRHQHAGPRARVHLLQPAAQPLVPELLIPGYIFEMFLFID